MVENDFPAFAKMLDTVYSLHGKSLNGESKALFFRAMAQFPLPMVRAAMDAHVRDPDRGQYAPKPADLMAQIVGKVQSDGRPGAEEAWAIAVKACDETETVVMNDEIAQAWGICKPIMDLGDEVGARMAFKEAYQRITAAATEPAKWWPSIGSDPHKRDAALSEAKRQGLLPAPQVAALPPPPMPTKATANPEGLNRVKDEVAKMSLSRMDPVVARDAAVKADRDAVIAAKRAIADRIEQYRKGAQQ